MARVKPKLGLRDDVAAVMFGAFRAKEGRDVDLFVSDELSDVTSGPGIAEQFPAVETIPHRLGFSERRRFDVALDEAVDADAREIGRVEADVD